jgi:cytochrome c oxidase subunit 4
MKDSIHPAGLYIKVWAILLLLLALTVGVAYLRLGFFNPAAALIIAAVKAGIIILYFMHVRYSRPLVWVFVGSGFVWLAILFIYTLSDYLTRSYMAPPTIW